MGQYLYRQIDQVLEDCKQSPTHKPLLLRGARQVGKSSAVKHLSLKFEYYAEVNFESQQPAYEFFQNGIDVKRIVLQLSLFLTFHFFAFINPICIGIINNLNND